MNSFCSGWDGKWVRFVNSDLATQMGGGGLEREAYGWMDESISADSIVAWGKGVAGGKAFVFNEKQQNVRVTGVTGGFARS